MKNSIDIINESGLNRAQIKMMVNNIGKFIHHIKKAYSGTLTSNVEMCGFKLLAPLGGRTYTQIIFKGNAIGRISKHGEYFLEPFTSSLWNKDKLKFDIMHNIKDEITDGESGEA